MTLMTNVRRNTIQSAADIPIAKMFPIDRLVFLAEVTPPRFSSLFLEGDHGDGAAAARNEGFGAESTKSAHRRNHSQRTRSVK